MLKKNTGAENSLHKQGTAAPLRGAAVFLWVSTVCASGWAEPSAPTEVVVTAERRAASIDTIAGSIALLAGTEIARIGAEHPAEILNRLPGVHLHRNNGLENLPAIRSPVLTGGQSAGSFLVLEDGVPIRAAPFANVNQVFETSLDFADRVEVTRGPGSAAYGANAVHGLVNVLTLDPADAAPLARVRGDSLGRASAEALFTLPGEAFVALSASTEAGWRAQSGLDRQHALFGFAGALGGWNVDGRVVAQAVAQETAGFVEGDDVYRDRAAARANPTPEAYRDTRLVRAQARFTTRPAGGVSLAVTPFARAIETDLILSFFPSRAQEITRQIGAGAQSALYWDPAPDISLLVGLDAEQASFSLRETQSRPTIGTFPQGLHYDYTVDASTLAGFAQGRFGFADHWSLTAGLRAERASLTYDNRAPDGDLGRFRRIPDRSDVFEHVAPKLALMRASPGGGAAFVTLSRGARAPQASDLYSLQTRQTAGGQGVELIDSAELGIRLPVSAGRIELVGYAMEKRGTSFRGADGFTVQDARTRHRGVEFAGEARLSSALAVAGWWTLARHTYRSESPADGVRIGAVIDTAPERIGRIGLTWRASDAMSAEVEVARTGRYLLDAAGTRDYPGHSLANLRIEAAVSPGVTAAFAVRNLTNEAYAERADFAFGSERYFPGEPRRFSVTLTARR